MWHSYDLVPEKGNHPSLCTKIQQGQKGHKRQDLKTLIKPPVVFKPFSDSDICKMSHSAIGKCASVAWIFHDVVPIVEQDEEGGLNCELFWYLNTMVAPRGARDRSLRFGHTVLRALFFSRGILEDQRGTRRRFWGNLSWNNDLNLKWVVNHLKES